MDGYLVVGRCGFDDVPLRLFADRDEALGYARGVNPQEVLEAARRLAGSEPKYLVGVAVVGFAGGEPGPVEPVRRFDLGRPAAHGVWGSAE